MPLIVRRGVDVAHIDLVPALAAAASITFADGFSPLKVRRPVLRSPASPAIQVHQPRLLADAIPIQRDDGGEAHQRVIAAPPRGTHERGR
jgi:hypothetical protein